MDDACVGPLSSKVIFWLTGVGVLAAKVQSTLDEEPFSTIFFSHMFGPIFHGVCHGLAPFRA